MQVSSKGGSDVRTVAKPDLELAYLDNLLLGKSFNLGYHRQQGYQIIAQQQAIHTVCHTQDIPRRNRLVRNVRWGRSRADVQVHPGCVKHRVVVVRSL